MKFPNLTVLGASGAVANATTAFAFAVAASVAAEPPVVLATAASYLVLAGQQVPSTGPLVLPQDLGVSPDAATTGSPPGSNPGVQHRADAVSWQIRSDLTVAYNSAGDCGPVTDQTGRALGRQRLVPGVDGNASTLAPTGTVTPMSSGTTSGTGSGVSVGRLDTGRTHPKP